MVRRLIAAPLALVAFLAGGRVAAQPGARPEGRTVEINGASLYYEVHGDGPPVVLLHQFGSSVEVWRSFIPAFAERFRVIAIDARGHGRSTNPSGQFSHKQAALDLLGVLDELQVDRFKAVGTSLGAFTLLHAATRQPDRVEAMVLVGGAPYFPEEARARFRSPDCGELTPEVWATKRKLHFRGDEQIREIERHFCAIGDVYDDVTFTPPHLATIKARTLIIHGDRDWGFPARLAVEMHEAIPNSSLWIVPNGGHMPIFDAAKHAEYEEAILHFLDET